VIHISAGTARIRANPRGGRLPAADFQ